MAIGFLPLKAPAQAPPEDPIVERFRQECRAQYAYLRGPGQHEVVHAHVRACVGEKLRAFAHATMAAPTSSATPIALVEATPRLVGPIRGPAQAKGVVYFVGGFSAWNRTLDDYRLAPYFLKSLTDDGWDVVGAKLPHNFVGAFGFKYVGGAAQTIRRRVGELRAQGYKRVVLAGHSWGAWAELIAARDGVAADALLLSAPGTFGERISPRDGEPAPLFSLGVSEFGPALSNDKIPTVLILPDDNVWDPDPAARGEIAEKHFSQAKVPYVLIAKPPGFFGHYAAWLPFFDFAYGKCIESFLEAPKTQTCPLPPLTSRDFRSILRLNQIADRKGKAVTSSDVLSGRKFVAYTLNDVDNKRFDYVSATSRRTMLSDGESTETVAFHDGQQCAGNACSVLIRWSDHDILEFDPKLGALKAWWVEDN